MPIQLTAEERQRLINFLAWEFFRRENFMGKWVYYDKMNKAEKIDMLAKWQALAEANIDYCLTNYDYLHKKYRIPEHLPKEIPPLSLNNIPQYVLDAKELCNDRLYQLTPEMLAYFEATHNPPFDYEKVWLLFKKAEPDGTYHLFEARHKKYLQKKEQEIKKKQAQIKYTYEAAIRLGLRRSARIEAARIAVLSK